MPWSTLRLPPLAGAIGLVIGLLIATMQTVGEARAADRSCGLRLDGAGPDARCSRYRDACLRYGNPEARCNERLDACTRCAVTYQDCEKRATGIARVLTSCEKCIADFKRCTREYDARLPAKRP